MAKIGVIHYNWPGFSFEQFLDYAAQIGCGYVELKPNDVWPDHALDGSTAALQSAAQKTRGLVEARGLQVSAFAAGNDFVQETESAQKTEVERMQRACIIAKSLGEETLIRSEGGQPKEGLSQDAQWDSMRACFQMCIPFLDEMQVSLAIDNHGVVTNDGDRLIALLNQIDHPRIGSNLDTMNFRWFGNSVEDCNRFYDALAPRVLHAHLKDGFHAREKYQGEALGEGELDLQHALRALKNVNYSGVYCAEYEGRELDGTGYKKCVDWLRANV